MGCLGHLYQGFRECRQGATQELGDAAENDQLIKTCLDLLQGAFLIHPPSRLLFSQEIQMQKVLQLLEAAGEKAMSRCVRHSAVSVLMAALLSSPTNTRVFEELRGLLIVTRLLESSSQETRLGVPVDSSLRKALVELLCVYLLPETSTMEPYLKTQIVPSPSCSRSFTGMSKMSSETMDALLPSSSSIPPCEAGSRNTDKNGYRRSASAPGKTLITATALSHEDKQDEEEASENQALSKESMKNSSQVPTHPRPQSRKSRHVRSDINMSLSFLSMAARYRGKTKPTEKKQAMLARYIPDFAEIMGEFEGRSDLVSCSKKVV